MTINTEYDITPSPRQLCPDNNFYDPETDEYMQAVITESVERANESLQKLFKEITEPKQ